MTLVQFRKRICWTALSFSLLMTWLGNLSRGYGENYFVMKLPISILGGLLVIFYMAGKEYEDEVFQENLRTERYVMFPLVSFFMYLLLWLNWSTERFVVYDSMTGFFVFCGAILGLFGTARITWALIYGLICVLVGKSGFDIFLRSEARYRVAAAISWTSFLWLPVAYQVIYK